MTTTNDTMRDKVLADLREARELIVAEIFSVQLGFADGKGYCVEVQGLPIQFDISDAGIVTNPRACYVGRVTRFTANNARRVAATICNGNGKTGRAVPVSYMLHKALESIDLSIKTFEEVGA